MKIALISMDQKWEDKAFNLVQCEAFVNRASNLGAELIIFPEMTLTGFTMNTNLSAEDADDSDSIAKLSVISLTYKISMIAGMVLKSKNKAENVSIAFDSKGIEQVRYSKIHPFTFAGEHDYFNAGNAIEKFKIGAFTIGLSICYDLRFPELYTALAKECNLLVNIANWPKRRIAHWKTLLHARAIENQTFVIGVNRTGVDGNGLEYEHSSLLLNANGEVIEPEVVDRELSLYSIQADELEQFKNSFSTTQDRKPSLYRTLI